MNLHLVALNCRYSHSCLALFYVRNELEKNLSGCTVSLSQSTINDPYYETFLRLGAESADCLFFSVYIWNSEYVQRLVADLVVTRPDIKIVLGGPQAGSLSELPSQCTVVLGEIEGVPDTFYVDLKAGSLKKSYLCQSGRTFSSPYRPDDLADTLKNRNVYYESSRGCPFSCAYCLSSISRGVNGLPVEQVTQELQEILLHEPKLIKFVDRTFNADAERTIAIWRFLAAYPGSTVFHFEIAPDLFSEEMFAFLAQLPPDKFQFEIGIQSTNPETLESVNRKMDLELARKNITRLLALDTIHLHLDLILGLPFETKETFRKSVNTVFNLKPHYVQMGLLKVLPDTRISKKAEEYGLRSCQMPPYQITATSWLDHEELSGLYWLGECIEAFYNNRYFRRFFSYLSTVEGDFFAFFEKVLSCSLKHNLFKLAKTQKLLNLILVEVVSDHREKDILLELLVFDWLSCGHRNIPPELFCGELKKVADELWHQMPPDYPELYTCKTRNYFFKKAVFFKFTGTLLGVVGLSASGLQGGYVCFLTENQEGVFKHRAAVHLQW